MSPLVGILFITAGLIGAFYLLRRRARLGPRGNQG
jgi:hypothetical protein